MITSLEEIIAEYDAILGQWEWENFFYNHLSNYTKSNYFIYGFVADITHTLID